MRELLGPLEQAMGGKVELDKNGRFYLNIPEQGRMEMPLLPAGVSSKRWRKGQQLDKNGRFYLNIPEQGRMEMPLVAEGYRKLAMMVRPLDRHGFTPR